MVNGNCSQDIFSGIAKFSNLSHFRPLKRVRVDSPTAVRDRVKEVAISFSPHLSGIDCGLNYHLCERLFLNFKLYTHIMYESKYSTGRVKTIKRTIHGF